jgi:hypothetical protein
VRRETVEKNLFLTQFLNNNDHRSTPSPMGYVASIALCQIPHWRCQKKHVTYIMSLMWTHQWGILRKCVTDVKTSTALIEQACHWHEYISDSWFKDMSQIWFLSVTFDSKTCLKYDSYQWHVWEMTLIFVSCASQIRQLSIILLFQVSLTYSRNRHF